MLNSILSAEISLTQYIICELTAMALGFGTALIFLVRDKHTSTFSQSLALLPGAVTLVIMLVNSPWSASAAPPAPPRRSRACSWRWPSAWPAAWAMWAWRSSSLC